MDDAREAGRELDSEAARTIARTCVAYAAAAGDPTDRCLTDPIFIPGADAGAAAVHDAKVIAHVPEWYRLTYMSGKDKQDTQLGDVKRRWYENRMGCDPKREPRGVECDEYPFYTTVEGGPAAYTRTPLVLEEVPVAENKAEGNALQRMQNDPRCNMATITKPRSTPGSGSQQFIVVPMAVPVPRTSPVQYFGPASFHVCGSSPGGGGPVIDN